MSPGISFSQASSCAREAISIFGLTPEERRGMELDAELRAFNRMSRAERSALHAEMFGSALERRAFARERELNARIRRIEEAAR